MIEKLKRGLLELIYDDTDNDLYTQTLRRRPVTHEFYEKVLILELDEKGDLIDESEEEGSLDAIYGTYLRKMVGVFVYRQILTDTVKAFYSEKYTIKELKNYARKVLELFSLFGVFKDDRRIALAVVNNRKILLVNDTLTDLSTMKSVKMPYPVDADILDVKSLRKYLKPLPYSKIRVVYFGTYEPVRRLFKGTRAVLTKFGYLTATVDEDWNIIRLGGDKNEVELEYGLVTFDELYSSLKNKTVRQMLLYVYDRLSPTAKKSIEAMGRKKNQLFENLVLYLSNSSLTARGVYVFKYKVRTGEKKAGSVFFVQLGGVRRVQNPEQFRQSPETPV